MVFYKIDSAQELWNFQNVDPLFLPLLQSNEHVWSSTLLSMTFPHLYSFLNTNDILNCRRVCKRLENSVDTFLESGQHLNRTLQQTSVYMRLENYCELFPRLKTVLHITEEMRMFPNAKILAGHVRCIFWREVPPERCRPFFQEQGHKIVHLFLGFGRFAQRINPLELITVIRETLERTPNLKSLGLFLSEVATKELCIPHSLWEDRVCRFLQENPLPALPNLIRLEKYEKRNVPDWKKSTCVTQGILNAYKGQLQKVYMKGVHASMPQGMGELTHLRIYTRNAGILQSLKNVRAPLQQIRLEFAREDFAIRFGEVFQLLQNCRSTLKDLTLIGSCTNDGCPANADDLNGVLFPVLESLKMEDKCVYNCANYDFLLGMPRLRQLNLTIRISKDNARYVEECELMATGSLRLTDFLEEDGVYTQVLNQERFWECAIWTHLTALRSVQIRKKTNCGERFPNSGY